jgi:hypothetical protein
MNSLQLFGITILLLICAFISSLPDISSIPALIVFVLLAGMTCMRALIVNHYEHTRPKG